MLPHQHGILVDLLYIFKPLQIWYCYCYSLVVACHYEKNFSSYYLTNHCYCYYGTLVHNLLSFVVIGSVTVTVIVIIVI